MGTKYVPLVKYGGLKKMKRVLFFSGFDGRHEVWGTVRGFCVHYGVVEGTVRNGLSRRGVWYRRGFGGLSYEEVRGVDGRGGRRFSFVKVSRVV